jgi:hypothetical protein
MRGQRAISEPTPALRPDTLAAAALGARIYSK